MLLPVSSSATTPLDTLQPQHPRLLIHDSDLSLIKHAIATDALAGQQYRQQLALGEKLLSIAPDTYRIEGAEHTLLSTSRDMESRIFTLAGLYRITGDKRFAARAVQEMLAAAAFPDWYPAHFLDTAELTAALGIGYDWLYAALSPTDRNTIHTAIVQKGLDPWISRIQSGKAAYTNNWSQVCNGGETIGALAVADEEPKRALEVLDHARPAIQEIMQKFAPDGGFEEGPVYWNYATSYNVLYIAALDSALGTDFGASDAPGFAVTGDYHIQSTGPFYQYANFGDARPDANQSPQMFWLAHRFHRPAYAAFERQFTLDASAKMDERAQRESGRFDIMGLFWSALDPLTEDGAPLPLAQSFTRVGQAYLRSAVDDQNAWYVALKGGSARASHGHLDLGTFVLDALGERWGMDLGAESYGLPGIWTVKRWDYYRNRTEAHNTLTVNAGNEDLDATATLIATGKAPNSEFAVVDLDEAYKGKLQSWRRGVALVGNHSLLVQDELAPILAADLVWNFHTLAAVVIASDGRSATLTEGGVALHARILAPDLTHFETASAQVAAPMASNQGVTDLVLRLPKQLSPQTIAVLFTRSDDSISPELTPLSTWR